MHDWSDETVDWRGISDAAQYIGDYCSRWGRIHVSDTKEKFGTVRVYCSLGFYDAYGIAFPRYHYTRQPWSWLTRLPIPNWMNSRIVIPIQARVYRQAYRNAVRRWPHLTCEILHAADFDQYLRGLGCPHERE